MFAQRGASGELRAGPYLAARFGAWSVLRADDVLASDVATIAIKSVVVVDTFRYAHDVLDCWLDCGAAWWVWRGVIAHGEGEWVTRGGRPEIRIK